MTDELENPEDFRSALIATRHRRRCASKHLPVFVRDERRQLMVCEECRRPMNGEEEARRVYLAATELVTAFERLLKEPFRPGETEFTLDERRTGESLPRALHSAPA